MKKFIILTTTAALLITGYSCKKSYTIGGSKFNPHVNMTTYDYLKTNHLFDTLIIMIDKMGLKDELNQSATFFAPTDYCINNYILAKGAYLRIIRNDENMPYSFDSLDLNELKDTMRSYMFHDTITRDNISAIGRLHTANDGEIRLIQLLPTTDYTSSDIFTTDPEYIYLTRIFALPGLPPIPTDSSQLTQVDPHQVLQDLCQTTGILTTTGVLHVMNNDHVFDYYNEPLP